MKKFVYAKKIVRNPSVYAWEINRYLNSIVDDLVMKL